MEIDFNNVRLQACNAYDQLCKKLNDEVKNNPELAERIQEDMDDLRMTIASIASSYLPNDPDVADVYADRRSLLCFSPEQ